MAGSGKPLFLDALAGFVVVIDASLAAIKNALFTLDRKGSSRRIQADTRPLPGLFLWDLSNVSFVALFISVKSDTDDCNFFIFRAVVISKDIFPYEQYKSQYGIERKKMKHFNLGLYEIEKTPNMSLSDYDENAPVHDEQPQSDDDDNESHKSDSSFQKSDLDNSSVHSSNYSASDSEDSDNKKGKRKNGKSTKSLSNKKKKKTVSSDDESDDDSSRRKKKPIAKKNASGNKGDKSKGKGKFSKNSFLRDDDSSDSEKKSSIAGSDSEVEKSPKPSDDNDSDDDLPAKRVKRHRLSDSEKEEEEEEESSKSSSKSNEKATDDHRIKDDSDSDSETIKKKKQKRILIDSDNSDSNESKLQIEKLKQKMEEKEREKERRKREKMEQKRQKRIAKEQHSQQKPTPVVDDQPADIKKFLENSDQTIKTSLAIHNPNVEKCLDALEKLGKVKLPDSGIQTYVASLKELISTLKKCKKYKADQRVRDKSDFCLENFRSFLLSSNTKPVCLA